LRKIQIKNIKNTKNTENTENTKIQIAAMNDEIVLWLVDSAINPCGNKKEVRLCEESLKRIRKFETLYQNGQPLSFSQGKNGYVICFPNRKLSPILLPRVLGIHQIIMNCFGNGKAFPITVDHIDRDKLNNCCSNLRIIDRKIQKENTKGSLPGTKRARKSNACELPEGITQEMLPKYVVYCCENLKGSKREFFQIENHPDLDKKRWIGTKSAKVSIFEKLNLAIEKIDSFCL